MASRRQWRLGAFAGGAIWAGVSGGISILLPLTVYICFARALAPVEIGHFALAVTLSEIVKIFGLAGLYEVLLQRRDEEERDQSAALGVFLLAGVLLLPVQSGLLLGVLALTDSWPSEGQLWLLLLMGLRVPIDLAMQQPQAELACRRAYARLAQRNMAANLGSAALGLGVLALGFPELGLATYTLAFSVAAALATIIGTGALRRPRWDPERLALLWREALAATGVRGAAAANSQLDQLLVGAMLGPLAFAHFNLGKRIELAFLGVSSTFSATLFQPHFAATRQGERRRATRSALVLLTATIGAGTACFVATADLVVGMLLGPAWLPAVPVTILLALSGYGRAIGSVHASLLSVSGRNALLLKCVIAGTILGVLLVTSASPFGAAVAAAAMCLRGTVTSIALAVTTRHDVGGSSVWMHLECACLPFLVMVGAAMAARGAVAGMAWASADVSLARSVLAILAAALAVGVCSAPGC
ncbi:MAG: oligosaccharide flippase family protein [Geminicoccaceae bacterium]